MIIASRTLFVTTSSGHQAVEIKIHQPIPWDGSWRCEATIGWPEGTASFKTGGFDSVQALVNALQMIAIQLYASTYHETGRLFWTKPGQGYGFPIAKNGRDLLVGIDKEFFG